MSAIFGKVKENTAMRTPADELTAAIQLVAHIHRDCHVCSTDKNAWCIPAKRTVRELLLAKAEELEFMAIDMHSAKLCLTERASELRMVVSEYTLREFAKGQ